MSKKDKVWLAEVKTALAEKYESLAKSVKSTPRRDNYLRKVKHYRRQAADAVRAANG